MMILTKFSLFYALFLWFLMKPFSYFLYNALVLLVILKPHLALQYALGFEQVRLFVGLCNLLRRVLFRLGLVLL